MNKKTENDVKIAKALAREMRRPYKRPPGPPAYLRNLLEGAGLKLSVRDSPAPRQPSAIPSEALRLRTLPRPVPTSASSSVPLGPAPLEETAAAETRPFVEWPRELQILLSLCWDTPNNIQTARNQLEFRFSYSFFLRLFEDSVFV